MLIDNLNTYDLPEFQISTLKIESESLKDNPLNDSHIRHNPLLYPKSQNSYKAVLFLSGFTGNGVKNFNFRSFEPNFIEEVSTWTINQTISPMIYVFVDAWTLWGGSQFINSKGAGNYEDYIIKELVPQVEETLKGKNYEISEWAVMGGSSGGYGALHLSSKYPDIFKHCLAIAPDCHFEVSLKPEIYHAYPKIESWGGIDKIRTDLINGELKTNSRDFHTVMNVLGMAHCYSDLGFSGAPLLPLQREGEFDELLWQEWLKKDPLHFLPNRLDNLKKLKTLFISVGEYDQFLLQFGARKLRTLLLEKSVELTYEEFKGNHFDISTRRKKALTLI